MEYTPPGTSRRQHVLRPHDWGKAAATDFWAFFGSSTFIETANDDLDQHGWLTTGFLPLAGSGADFLSSADPGVPGGLNFAAAGDLLTSPFIFGSHVHMTMVEALLGYAPTKLSMECHARFGSNAGDENETGFGFIEAGGAAITLADEMAYISVGATLFEMHSGAVEDAGAAQDTDPHLWKIEITKGGSAEWFIDGTSQGSIAIQTDLWPCAFSAGTLAGTGVNDPVLQWVHVWYD